jgi:hypothetical protein
VLRRAQDSDEDVAGLVDDWKPAKTWMQQGFCSAVRNTKRATGTAAFEHVSVLLQTQCVLRCPLESQVGLVRGRANCIMPSPLRARRGRHDGS